MDQMDLECLSTSDTDTTEKDGLVNETTINLFMRLVCRESTIAECTDSMFVLAMSEEGWSLVQHLFSSGYENQQNNHGERKPCITAPLLLVPIFSGPREYGHWNLAIRDARGLKSFSKACWRYFDSYPDIDRELHTQTLVKSSELWQEGMRWEHVPIPRQTGNNCGPWTCLTALSYVRWSENQNLAHMNSSQLNLNVSGSNAILETASRQLLTETELLGELPVQHSALDSIHFFVVPEYVNTWTWASQRTDQNGWEVEALTRAPWDSSIHGAWK